MRKPSLIILLTQVFSICLAQEVSVDGYLKTVDGSNGFIALDGSRLFGGPVVSLGDINGDGINDLLAAGSKIDQRFIYVLFLDKNGKVTSQQEIGENMGGLSGDIPGNFDGFAWDMCPLGDLNNDGIPDFAASHYLDRSVFIIFLNKDGTAQSFKRIKDGKYGFKANLSSETRFGSSLTLHDDLDGDGINELLVGDTEDRGRKSVLYLLYLDNSGSVKSFKKIEKSTSWNTPEPYADNNFGGSLAVINDINKDGISELVVSAPFDGLDGVFNASYYIIFHDKDFVVDSVKKFYPSYFGIDDSLAVNAGFGVDVESLGDLDGNGVDDLGFSAQRDSSLGKETGSAFILFLDSMASVDTFLKITGGTTNFTNKLNTRAAFGRGICSPGDLNGDGTRDLTVGAWADDEAGTFSGALFYIYLTGKKYVTTQSPNALEASIYPNPASNTFQINTKEQTEVKVLNACGQVIWQGKALGQQTIDASQWQAGMYFVLISEANHDLSTQKLIIQH